MYSRYWVRPLLLFSWCAPGARRRGSLDHLVAILSRRLHTTNLRQTLLPQLVLRTLKSSASFLWRRRPSIRLLPTRVDSNCHCMALPSAWCLVLGAQQLSFIASLCSRHPRNLQLSLLLPAPPRADKVVQRPTPSRSLFCRAAARALGPRWVIFFFSLFFLILLPAFRRRSFQTKAG